MKPVPEPAFVRRYLLGLMPEKEENRFELEYFESDSAFDELVAGENELIDAHLAGHLTPEEQEAFASHFLSSPEREERVAFARALRATISAAPPAAPPAEIAALLDPPRPRVAAWLGWAAAVVCLVPASWAVVRVRALEGDLRAGRAVVDAAGREASTMRERLAAQDAEIAGLRDQVAHLESVARRAATELAPFVAVLRAGATRDLHPRARIVVPSGATALHLQVVVSDDVYASYEGSLETPDRKRVAIRRGLAAIRSAAGRVVEIRLDPRAIASGTYVALVRGIPAAGEPEVVAEYEFQLAHD